MKKTVTHYEFTLFDLIVVMICVSIVGILLLPFVSHMGHGHGRARRVNCAGNLKQIGLALLMYSGENDGYFPTTPNGNNFEPLNTETILNDGKVYGCPSAEILRTSAAFSNYDYLGYGIKDDDPLLPNSTKDDPRYRVIARDQSGNHPDNDWMNALFVDGHVEGSRPNGKKKWNTYQ